MIDVEKRKHVYGRKIGGLFGSLFAFSSLDLLASDCPKLKFFVCLAFFARHLVN